MAQDSAKARKTRSGKSARIGLKYWAARAAEEVATAAAALDPDPVHDLRVAIRRCRSLAEGLRTIDPAPGWKRFRSLPKPLFSALGALRDTQVLEDWLHALAPAKSRARHVLGVALAHRAEEQKQVAREAMREFDVKRWLKLAEELDKRARRLRPGSRVFQHLALERWEEAVHLHDVAMRTRAPGDLHQLRIGVKRFRYTVENFLPRHHELWSHDLKHMQDLLGEVHDLDVFLVEVRRHSGLGAARKQLLGRIQRERAKRIRKYEQSMTGPGSLWSVWRKGLPSGRDLSLAINAKLRHWAGVVDPEPAHSRRVAQISARLWDGLRRQLRLPRDQRSRALLRAAALLHNVGGSKRRKKRASYRARMMGKLSVPVGWSGDEMQMVRLVSRYGSGELPSCHDEGFSRLAAGQRQQVIRLAGILRLAHALDISPTGTPSLELRQAGDVLTLFVARFDPLSPQAAELAGARHLLEVALQRPIVMRDLGPTSIGTWPASASERPATLL